MNALIIVNGDLPSGPFLQAFARRFKRVFVTDGAASSVDSAIDVSAICGDFDSISAEDARCRFPAARIVELPDQNRSDLEKTIDFARSEGASTLSLVGALGGRIDHALVSISTLLQYHRELPISITDGDTVMTLLSARCAQGGSLKFDAAPGDTISLISFEDHSTVSISGVQWPLVDAQLKAGSAGVSNRAVGGAVAVRVSSGCVAVVRPLAIDCNR